MTILSKAYDSLSHELMITKLDAHVFDKKYLKLVYSYLSNRKRNVSMRDSYNSLGDISFWVPQGSILGTIFFNIFICDIFYILEDHESANSADDSTSFSAKTNHKLVSKELEKSSSILFKWRQTNHIKVNTDKGHHLLSGNTQLT